MKEKILNKLNIYRARFLISMKIYFRYPMNVILTFFEPLIWLTPFYFMGKSFSVDGKMTGFQQYTGNSDFMGFLVVGYIISAYVSTVFWALGFSLKEEMRQGVLESNWSAPVSRITLLVSKSVFYFCATTVEVIITGIVCHFVFGFTINGQILKAILFLIPGIIGMMGLGMIIAGLVLIAKDANPIIDLTNSAIMGFSGSFFPIKVMPRGFIFVSLIIPITYIYDSTRAILINQKPIFNLRKEFIILCVAMIVLCILGNFIFMKIDKKCRSKGILGTH
ncbi:ABC transporter permease [Haloimpatiens sp. FM7330]|uniref:ABC transporter permease n=1 Tax=Haloimpatiens sp. FM7330 TaxID=3298610 RepID=UPI0036328154